MPEPTPAFRVSLARARAAWIAAQEIGRGDTLIPTLERTGFIRTLGGTEVYLAVRARLPSVRASEIDAAVAAGQAQVVPAVRGCIYLVARRFVPLALRVAELSSRKRDERDHEKAGIHEGELDAVGAAALEALRKHGPLTTDALRKALPDGVVRSLGEAGKKVGISSPLPPALRKLEFAGRVERTLERGRLDTERYLWRAAAKSPFDAVSLPDDPVALWAEVAKVFFRAAGMGTIRDFAEWAGLGVRDAIAAAERARLIPIAIEGVAETAWALAENEAALRRDVDVGAACGLLPFEDNVVALHGGPGLLVDPAHHGIRVPQWGMGGEATIAAAKHMQMRSAIAEGRIVALWEYDPDAKTAELGIFDSVSAQTRARLEDLSRSVGRYLSDEVGHGRSFTLDTDDALRERAAFVRKLAGGKGAAKNGKGKGAAKNGKGKGAAKNGKASAKPAPAPRAAKKRGARK